jgi:putative hemolysin
MNDPVLLVVGIFICLIGNGIFSGSEIAIISARRSQVEARIAAGSKAAVKLKHLQENMNDFLATVQIGVTLMGTLAGVLGGYLASLYIEPWVTARNFPGWLTPTLVATVVVGGGIVYTELILGELVPKALALKFTERVALLMAPPLYFMARASHGLVVLLTKSTRAILALVRVKDTGHRTFVSEEEIKHLVTEGRAQGVLDFAETPVKRVMIPRPNIFALDADTPPGEAERLMIESGFSRIPVYESSLDGVIGVAYAKDALRLLERRQPVVLRKILHPVHLVPETKKVGALLKELQKRRTHIALVIDEHGSLAGLVTMEDLIEEIVGDIQDEYDWEERPVERQRDGSLVVEGTVSAADLRENYKVPIPDSPEFETVAGYMLHALGSVPKGGEVVTAGEYRLTVVDVDKTRISKVKIERTPVAATPSPKRYLR